MLPAATEEEQRLALARVLAGAGLTFQQMWIDYFALGGDAGELEVEGYLAGLMPLPALQRDMLAQALNERLDAAAPAARAPYSRVIRDSLPGLGPLAALVQILAGAHRSPPGALPGIATAAAAKLGVELTIYLADYQQRELIPVGPGGRDRPVLSVDSTLAGRAFRLLDPVVARNPAGLWLPLLDGTERLGVLEIVSPTAADLHDPLLREQCQWLAVLLGHLVTVTGRYGDALDTPRRRAPRSSAAELVWSLLPPLTAGTATCTVSGALEPSYAVGGDTFDYSLSDTTATVAVFDAMGHGLAAGLLSAAALAAGRAVRRNGMALLARAEAIDDAVASQAHGEGFVTGVIGELDLGTGRLRYLAAGHPAPLLIRGGRVVATLGAGRRLPFGLGAGQHDVAEATLEPGDWLALYTDGVTEARDADGQFFGIERLVDFLERAAAAALPTPESLRRLIHAVLAHQAGVLQDDATVMLAHWHPVLHRPR